MTSNSAHNKIEYIKLDCSWEVIVYMFWNWKTYSNKYKADLNNWYIFAFCKNLRSFIFNSRYDSNKATW